MYKRYRYEPLMMNYLIALDLDGTLTNERKEITPHTYDTLMRTQQMGARLCLASGRPPYGMRPLAEQLHMAEYGGLLVCYNGGHIEECATGRVLTEQTLCEELLPQLVAYQNESGLTLMTYHDDTIYTEQPQNTYVMQSSRNNKMRIQGVKNFINDTPRPINKCLMVGHPSLIPQWEERMATEMGNLMHILHSTPYFIELLPPGIDKGTALSIVLDHYGMQQSQLIAFGDSHNDIDMLRLAGIGVAMGNAEEEVKAAANHVTLTNEEDGIAVFLEKHIFQS